MDTLMLARWQSGLTLVSHFLFVPLTLGLVFMVALMETFYVMRGDETYRRMARFWGQLYIINYAMGFLTGLVQEFQFGLSWSAFSSYVGNVFGAPLAIETLLAFFLDATFFGFWLASWDIVPKKVHLAFIWIVALGVYLSAVFILIANGFMQEPVGYEIHNGQLILTNISALISNPNFLIALEHVTAGSLLTGAFFVSGVSAFNLLRRTTEHTVFRNSLRLSMVIAFVSSLAVLEVGGAQIQNIRIVQPMKAAAMFGEAGQAAILQAQFVKLYGPGNYIPFMPVTVTTFHAMVIIAALLLIASLIGLLLLWKDAIVRQRWFLRLLSSLIALPYLANISGWLTREMGRQPWVVQGLLKTSDALSPSLNVSMVFTSLLAFTLIYASLAVIDVYLLCKYGRLGLPGSPDTKEQESSNEETENVFALQ